MIKFLRILLTIGLVCCALATVAYATPQTDTLPLTTQVYDRAGNLVSGTTSIGVRVKDPAGNGVNGTNVVIEICSPEIALPCSSWVNAVSGKSTTVGGRWANLTEDGWVLTTLLDNVLARVTCGTAQQTQYIASGITQVVIVCVQNPTAVLIQSITATVVSYGDYNALFIALAFILGGVGSGLIIGAVKWIRH